MDKQIALEIMVFQSPKTLRYVRDALIAVYAAPKNLMKVIKERNRDCLQVALPKTIIFLLDKRNLKIHVSEVEPNDVWEPQNCKGEITYQDIISNEIHPFRQFRFVKKDGAEDVSVITGAISISQDDSGSGVYYFSSDMLQPPQKQGTEMISDREIIDVALKARLSHDQLEVLYTELDISSSDIEKAQRLSDTNDFKLQAIEVLKHWRATKGREATREAIIEALEECRWKESKEFLEEKWAIRTEMISDREIYDVALKASLSHDQLEVLYMVLDISSSDVEKAQRLSETNDFKLQAIEVLSRWRSTHGREATRESIIAALKECGWKESKEVLEQKWRMHRTPAEILAQGPEAYQAYRDAIAEGRRAIQRTRLMIVGQERVGKTSLKNTLTNQPFDKDEISTDGIDVSDTCSIDISHSTSWKVKKDDDNSTDMLEEAVGADLVKKLGAVTLMETEATKDTITTPESKGDILAMYTDDSSDVATSGSGGYVKSDKTDRKTDPLASSNVASSSGYVKGRIPEKIISVMGDKLENETEPLTFSIWDFAGQDLYYTTHQVFLSQRSVYVLVFDLRHDLELPVQLAASSTPGMFGSCLLGSFQAEHHVEGQKPPQSAVDILDFWMRSIYTFIAPDNLKVTGNGIHSPPIFIVGTHRGHEINAQRAQKQFEILRQFIAGKRYEQHIVQRFYQIENSLEDDTDQEVVQLREDIDEIAREQPYMREEIPIRWLQFEQSIKDQISQGSTVLELEKVKQLPGLETISSDKEFEVMLQFYHDLGYIVYFADGGPELKNLVVLDAHWLIDVFRRIITWKHKDMVKQDNEFKSQLDQLLKCAILNDNLASSLWDNLICGHLDRELQKKYLIRVMERFDLLCERLSSKQMEHKEPHRKSYYVPARLQPHQSNRSFQRILGPSTVFFVDFMGFLPDGFFNRLLTRCARWSQEQGGFEPQIEYRHAVFYADDDHKFELEMLSPKEATTKVTVFPSTDKTSGSRPFIDTTYSLRIAANKVRMFLETTVHDLKTIWMKGIVFGLAVICPKCTTDQHQLDLNLCLQSSYVHCQECRKRVDTIQIQDKFISSGSVVQSAIIDQEGGTIAVAKTGAAVRIPRGAISAGPPIEVSVAVHWDKEFYPPLSPGDLVIGPAIHCRPEGLTFRKPVEITFPHSAENVSAKSLTMWMNPNLDTNSEWQVIWSHNTSPSSDDKDARLIVNGNKVTLLVHHFSIFSPVIDAIKGKPLDMLPFMHPPDLSSDSVFVTIFAIREDQIKNVRTEQSDMRSGKCGQRMQFRIKKIKDKQNDLNITAELVGTSSTKWTPPSISETIPYQRLQYGNRSSQCTLIFNKGNNTKANEIMGRISGHYNEEEVIPKTVFSNTMCQGYSPKPVLEEGDRYEGREEIRVEPVLGYFLHCNIPSVSAEGLRDQHNLDKCYDMRTNEKGRAFLLNLHYYENSVQDIRKGSEIDVANIRHVMDQAGFSFQDDMVLKDAGHRQIKETYKNFIQRCKGFKNLKCIAVILMAHGGLGYICCEETHRKKKIPLTFFFDELEQTSEFKDIPKIFIIQACRQVNFEEDTPDPPNPIPKPHSIRIYSTSEGHGSTRDFNKGSIFTQAFVKVLLENAHREHLMDMLLKVKWYTEELRQDTPETDKIGQVPEWEQNLKKKLYLIPQTT